MDKTSQLFFKTSRHDPKDEQSINARLLERAGFVYKNSAGIYTYLPLGWRVIQNIAAIIREEMNAIGGQEMFMPALHDQHYLKATGRWDVDVVFKVMAGEQKEPEFNISWTHEEIMSEVAARFVNSYKDLPFSTYQIQTKFRNEPRAKSGLLRGREFMMKDLYSFHRDEKDLDAYYLRVKKAYQNIFERCHLKAYYTLAAGGDFTTNFTHEFQVECQAGEDSIYVCRKCNYAENKEVSKLSHGSTCPECSGEIEEKKSIEVGNIFRYGTKYSEPFNLRFTDEDGQSKLVHSGAYGIGLGRLMGTVVEVNSDDRGIIWPDTIAPYDVIIVDLLGDETKAKEISQIIESSEKSVLLDDRTLSAGEKLADADLLGIPWRVVVSSRSLEQGGVALKRRSQTDETIVALDDLVYQIK